MANQLSEEQLNVLGQAYDRMQAEKLAAARPNPATNQIAPVPPDQRWGWQKRLDDAGLQTLKDATTGVGQGVVPFADEIYSGMLTPFEMIRGAYRGEDAKKPFAQRISDSYSRALEFNRKFAKEAADRSPTAYTMGEITGAINTAGKLAQGGVTLLNAARPAAGNMLVRGAGEGALYNSIYGFSQGEGVTDRVNKGLWGLAGGLVTGALAGAVTGKLAQNAALKRVPAAEASEQQAQAAYRVAEDAGVAFNPEGYAKAFTDMRLNASRQRLDPVSTPNAVQALKHLEELKSMPLTLQNLHDKRKFLNDFIQQAANKRDHQIASMLFQSLDDYVKGAETLIAKGSPQVRGILNQGLEWWGRTGKIDQVGNARARADYRVKAKNELPASALRDEFSALKSDRLAGFAEPQQRALDRVANGAPIEKILRQVGKADFRSFPNTKRALGLDWAAIPAELSSAAANAITVRNARMADALVRAGGQLPVRPLSAGQRVIIDSLFASQPAFMKLQQPPGM